MAGAVTAHVGLAPHVIRTETPLAVGDVDDGFACRSRDDGAWGCHHRPGSRHCTGRTGHGTSDESADRGANSCGAVIVRRGAIIRRAVIIGSRGIVRGGPVIGAGPIVILHALDRGLPSGSKAAI